VVKLFFDKYLASPSTEKLLLSLLVKPNAKHVVYDCFWSEALDAFEAVYGERALVDYDFSKASLIVSVGADFLGDWQGGGYDAGYAKGRSLKQEECHVTFN
jgi:molybdopterin-containing oxidoreductase family iron-sulfur binding subunit